MKSVEGRNNIDFIFDLLKAREIMGEDRPWELRRLGREVRGLNVGKKGSKGGI